jgi:hypothetical protein
MARGGSAPAYGHSQFLAITDHEKAGRISDFLFKQNAVVCKYVVTSFLPWRSFPF